MGLDEVRPVLVVNVVANGAVRSDLSDDVGENKEIQGSLPLLQPTLGRAALGVGVLGGGGFDGELGLGGAGARTHRGVLFRAIPVLLGHRRAVAPQTTFSGFVHLHLLFGHGLVPFRLWLLWFLGLRSQGY